MSRLTQTRIDCWVQLGREWLGCQSLLCEKWIFPSIYNFNIWQCKNRLHFWLWNWVCCCLSIKEAEQIFRTSIQDPNNLTDVWCRSKESLFRNCVGTAGVLVITIPPAKYWLVNASFSFVSAQVTCWARKNKLALPSVAPVEEPLVTLEWAVVLLVPR